MIIFRFLIVDLPGWPFTGASPDGAVECTCCGRGVLEVRILIEKKCVTARGIE